MHVPPQRSREERDGFAAHRLLRRSLRQAENDAHLLQGAGRSSRYPLFLDAQAMMIALVPLGLEPLMTLGHHRVSPYARRVLSPCRRSPFDDASPMFRRAKRMPRRDCKDTASRLLPVLLSVCFPPLTPPACTFACAGGVRGR